MTMGVKGEQPLYVMAYAVASGARMALDIRPGKGDKRLSEMLRWRGRIPETRMVPGLANPAGCKAGVSLDCVGGKDLIDRLVATLRRKRDLLILCECIEPWRCQRRYLADRVAQYGPTEVIHFGFEDKAPVEYAAPTTYEQAALFASPEQRSASPFGA